MAGDEERPSSEPEREAVSAGEAPDAAIDGLPAGIATPRLGEEAPDGPIAYESRAPDDVAKAPRRSVMPAVLAVIGIVLMVLLAANLYTLYNPPANDALTAAVADVGALRQRVAAVEAKPSDTSAVDARVATLAAELQQTKGAVERNSGGASAGDEAKAAIQPLDAKVTTLAEGLNAVQGTVAALPKVDLTPLQDRVAALDKRLGPLEAYFTAPKALEQVTEARQNGSAAETRAAPLAVIAAGVLTALDTGRPFPTEVKALQTLGVDAATLAPLQAVADKGAPTPADLATGFAAVQDGVVVAAAPVETGTMFDRILANAQGIVKVTRTGAGTGGDAAAVASRITDALKRGDLPAAATEWDKLPAPSKARSADWDASLQARLKAEDAARSIQGKAVAALAAVQ